MKLNSLITGAFCVLLLIAAQNVSAQNIPAQDKTLPPPDQEGSALPAPNRETSVIPMPSSRPERAPVPPAAPSQSEVEARSDAGSDVSIDTGSQAPEDSEQEAPAPSLVQNNPARATSPLPAKGWYIGAMAGAAYHFYDTDDTDVSGTDVDGIGSFNGGLYFGIDTGLVTGEIELLIVQENASAEIYNGYGYEEVQFSGTSLLIPLIFKLDFHLGPVVLQPLFGFYLNFALEDLKEEMHDGSTYHDPYANPLFGLMFGGTLGIKAGRGIIFLDTRYAMDLGKTKAGNDPRTIFKRSGVMLNLGYQFYFGGKK